MTGSGRGPSAAQRRRSTHVFATSVRHPTLAQTTEELRQSDNEESHEASRTFHKRVLGLLVLQYTAILVIASPFALLESVQSTIQGNETLHTTLECIAIFGIVASLVAAVTYGSKFPVTQICLVTLTISVALEMSISFADGSLGTAGYIAIGQATTSFALMLALMQFDFEWMDYMPAIVLCFLAAFLWVGILFEQGYSIWPALGIGMGGFAFVCLVFGCTYAVGKHVTPDEYVLATLFILCPEALLCIGAKDRHVEEGENGGEDGGESRPLV